MFRNITYIYHIAKFHLSSLTFHKPTLAFREYIAGFAILHLVQSSMNVVKKSSLIINNISTAVDKAIISIDDSWWRMENATDLNVTNTQELSIEFSGTNASLYGQVRIANNTKSYNIRTSSSGVLFFESSTVEFYGSLEVVGNMENGGITASNSDLFFYGRAKFSDNYSRNGGAITLVSSLMCVSVNATVEFNRNFARWLGGAIYISEQERKTITQCGIISCSIQLLEQEHTNCQWFSITFNQNKAGIAGNAIYEDYTSASQKCLICFTPNTSYLYTYSGVNDSSDLSSFTSDPTRVCLCDNGIPDCFKARVSISVHPGEYFSLSLVLVGYGLGTVPGSVVATGNIAREEEHLFGSELQVSQEVRGTECQDIRYSVVSERHTEQIVLGVEVPSFLLTLNESLSNFPRNYISLHILPIEFLHIPVFLHVNLLLGPFGFQPVKGKCVCHLILLDNNIDTCFFHNRIGLFLRPPHWIGLLNENKSWITIIVQPHCPFDYCHSDDVNITAEFPNTQCQYQRSGILCGSCREGLSMMLGSSGCMKCSSSYLGLMSIFVLAGVVLVIILTLLNMTVSVGTLNGLIFFAIILQANQTTFLLTTRHHMILVAFLRSFTAWLNLDIGIPICFFNGLTTYIKTWLQFVFPAYILALVGAIIIAS